jgi:hypothetical protein
VKRVDEDFSFESFFFFGDFVSSDFGTCGCLRSSILSPGERERGGGGQSSSRGREGGREVLLFPSFYLLLHQFGGKDFVGCSKTLVKTTCQWRMAMTAPRAVKGGERYFQRNEWYGLWSMKI